MTEPSGGGQVTVVEPGSEDDPFTKGVAGPDATVTDDTTSQPDSEFKGDDDAKLLQELKGYMDTEVQGRVSKAQSGWDTRNRTLDAKVAGLEKELRTTRRQAEAAGMSEDDRQAFQEKWNLEDLQASLETKTKAVDDYHRVVKLYDLTTRYGDFGVTEELLEPCEAPEDMELLAEKTRADFLATGKKPGSAGKKTPAGASAKTDVGGGPAGKEEFKLGAEQSVQAMASNVSKLFRESGSIK